MAAQHSVGIQTLLDAEKEASKVVQQARVFMIKRVKQARDEAKAEIEAYRASKEDEFQTFQAEHSRGNEQAEMEANKEADARIQEITAAGKRCEDQVVKNLLSAVLAVKTVDG